MVLSIEFVVTNDKESLSQYYALRERCFRAELGLPQFDGSEEEEDRQGHILLAMQDGRCVGGARISSRITLPSQVENLNLSQDSCCMWERFVIDPAVRKIPMIREFIAQLIYSSRDLGYAHAMVLSSLCNARFYRRCLTSLEVGFEIQRHVPHCAQGSFAGLEHYLSIAYLKSEEPMRVAI